MMNGSKLRKLCKSGVLSSLHPGSVVTLMLLASVMAGAFVISWSARAEEDLPWLHGQQQPAAPDQPRSYQNNRSSDRSYLPPGQDGEQDRYQRDTAPRYRPRYQQDQTRQYPESTPQDITPPPARQYDAPPPSQYSQHRYNQPRPAPVNPPTPDDTTYSSNEVIDIGHRFFGKVSGGLASAIEYVFRQKGRPVGYILGEEAGGALVAGLRYGEGILYTKWGEKRRIYWQGPSFGYDFGAAGAKTIILVYNLRNINDIYTRFGAVDGSAYLVGGLGVTFENRDKLLLARIQSGVGLKLGANIGYIKYTPRPTWNPF